MAPPDAAVAHYEQQIRQAQAAVLLARRQWRRMTPDDLDRSWADIVQRLTIMVASGMLGAAKAGAAYVPDVLGADAAVDGSIGTARFAQTASDGRPLDSLLYSAVIRTKISIGAGATPQDALDGGGEWLNTLVRTQVADAGRGATSVGITARPRVGYVRLITPPCCQRCAVLAGKRFKWNAGFQRHPKCDCRHVPCADDASSASLSPPIQPDQVKDLTEVQRRAVADGADLNQVVNAARKGARSADGMTTTEGTTRRGYASHVQRSVDRQRGQQTPEVVTRARAGGRNASRVAPRPTPDLIYRLARDREEAVRLLARHGYIVGDIDKIARSVA